MLTLQLGTSDKDFTSNTSRLGGTSGAYADTHGRFQGNKSGPGGNTALTGREGTFENNPVAQAKSAAGEDVGTTTSGTGTGAGAAQNAEGGEQKSLMQKVKDALI